MRNPIQLVVRKVLGEVRGYEVRSVVVRKVLGEVGGYEVRSVDFFFKSEYKQTCWYKLFKN